MKRLFASGVFVLLVSTSLAAQVIPPPPAPRRAASETKIYLITFRRDVPYSQRAALVLATGARLRRIYNAANAASVEIPDVAALARLRNDPRVSSVFVNRTMRLEVAQGRAGGSA